MAYPPVVAAGDNANIIHYTRYSKAWTSISSGLRVGNVFRDPNKLLPHERYIKLKNW